MDKNDTSLADNSCTSSKVIKYVTREVEIEGVRVYLGLVTMKSSFLVVVNSKSFNDSLDQMDDDHDKELSREAVIRGFSNSNDSLRGLSLAIGEHSTCLINSESSVASSTLATRLSKKLNQNRPVYVANNFHLPHDTLDPDGFVTKLYMRIFQFVRSNYCCPERTIDDQDSLNNKGCV